MISIRMLKERIVSYTPEFVLLFYHYLIALLALIVYRFPSKKLIVIGVTGTKGKTSTSMMIYDTLTAVGKKVGLISTVAFSTGGQKVQNKYHMTLPGRFFVQRQLRAMVNAGCQFVVMETTSEGIRQFRNLGVIYDSIVFTNLAPEHLQTHKTFENYRDTKMKLFRTFAKREKKHINGIAIDRVALVNVDDNHGELFLQSVNATDITRIRFGVSNKAEKRAIVKADGEKGIGETSFTFEDHMYTIPTVGIFAVQNVLPAIILTKHYVPKASVSVIAETIATQQLPGRMERIVEGQEFTVLLDYAHEPLSVRSALQAARKYIKKEGKLVSLTGAVGGGRWRYNAESIGTIARQYSDIAIFTQNDPELDDPEEILNAMVVGAEKSNGGKYYTEVDRKKAIHDALAYARKDDVVLIAGKGVEVTAKTADGTIVWDEKEIVRTALHAILFE